MMNRPNHHPKLLLLLLATLAAIGLVLHLHQSDNLTSQSRPAMLVHAREPADNPASRATDVLSPENSDLAGSQPPHSSESLGQTILRDYADPTKTPAHDLALLAQLMENFTLLVKTAVDRPLSSNEEWSQALRGLNPARERFLPDKHVAFNAEDQLIDRWGSPLFFHSVARGQFDIRSAGPDRRLWTADDLQRNADGSFFRGGTLDSADLSPR